MATQPLTFADIRVPLGLKFKDISGEVYRIYHYGDCELCYEDPIALHVSGSGGHRLILSDGTSVYVRDGWLAFEFKVKDDDRPHWRF